MFTVFEIGFYNKQEIPILCLRRHSRFTDTVKTDLFQVQVGLVKLVSWVPDPSTYGFTNAFLHKCNQSRVSNS